jgi:2-polyprenyl-6-methoxyphenol hydroxylase-like FAD-dependent oxidoreductase
VRRGITILPGKRLVDVEHTAAGVRAIFADGSDVHGTLLVGADGLHSRTRELIDPRAPAPRYTGLLSIGGRAVTRSLDPTPDTFHMIFGHQAFFGYTVRPSGDVLVCQSCERTNRAKSRSSQSAG